MADAPQPIVLEYVEIHALRHVRSGSRVVFGRGINVVLGRNGTGKTTLLELLSAIERNDFHAFARESFAISFAMRAGDARVEGKLTNVVDERRREFRFVGEYRVGEVVVAIESNGERATLVHEGRTVEVPRPIIEKDAEGRASDILEVIQRILAPPSRMTLSKLPGSKRRILTRIEEGTETFWQLFDTKSRHVDNDPTFGVTIVFVRLTDLMGHILDEAIIGHHVPEAHQLPGLDRNASSLELRHDTFASLGSFVALSQYSAATLIFTRTSHLVEDQVNRITFGKPSARFELRNGNEIPDEQLSYGEKRLLTFLIKLHAEPSAILVDELANGMHYAWIEACIDMLEERRTQAFLSSQNPLLLDALPLTRETFGSVHGIVVCELDEEGGQMVWRNPSAREAEDFFTSYDVGIQYISEIMRNKGLW